MAGRLTTHVLDIMNGIPAANMEVELWKLEPEKHTRTWIKTVRTNEDGRTNEPLLADYELKKGVYELVFSVGEYFAAQGATLGTPVFLDYVPVRFGVSDAKTNYHVPLLTSPWAYSTYRGS